MEKISEHISYAEATNSIVAKRHNITNEPNEDQLLAMKHVANNVFEPLRNHFDTKIYVSSFFRSDKLNNLLGGAKSSQHTKGEAIDIDADVYNKVTNKELFDYIKDNLEFDQLVAENVQGDRIGWIHVSLKQSDNRHEVLIMEIIDGKRFYRLVD